jgi:hypothetical protein
VPACKLARPDAGCVRFAFGPAIVRALVRHAPAKGDPENLCKAIPATVWSQINPDQDIAIEQVVGGNGGKGSFHFSCRKYLAQKTD